MGDTLDLESETFIFKSRGEGRPPQRLLVREEPLRSTQTLTVELREGGLYTIFVYPSMPYPDNDPEGHWERNFLAFPLSNKFSICSQAIKRRPTMRLTPKDKKVIESFLAKRPMV